MAVKDKTVFKVPVQIDGRVVTEIWFAHGTSDSTIATLAMNHPDIKSALGSWGEIDSVSAVPFQPVNIITKPIEEEEN